MGVLSLDLKVLNSLKDMTDRGIEFQNIGSATETPLLSCLEWALIMVLAEHSESIAAYEHWM